MIPTPTSNESFTSFALISVWLWMVPRLDGSMFCNNLHPKCDSVKIALNLSVSAKDGGLSNMECLRNSTGTSLGRFFCDECEAIKTVFI